MRILSMPIEAQIRDAISLARVFGPATPIRIPGRIYRAMAAVLVQHDLQAGQGTESCGRQGAEGREATPVGVVDDESVGRVQQGRRLSLDGTAGPQQACEGAGGWRLTIILAGGEVCTRLLGTVQIISVREPVDAGYAHVEVDSTANIGWQAQERWRSRCPVFAPVEVHRVVVTVAARDWVEVDLVKADGRVSQ